MTKGRVLDYVGMSFDFTKRGEVKVTMGNCVNDILDGCENFKEMSSLASPTLFDVRSTTKATVEESAWFHSMTAKVLGGPCSHRSRHINIRRFGLCEKVDERLGTEQMIANVLTKPVQGAQFIREHGQLTNWM